MSAVTTGRGWYLFFNRIKNSRSEKLDHTRRITGLEKLIESENDSGDYSFKTLFIGHKKLPAELSAFCPSTYLSVGRKVTGEPDLDIQDLVV